MKNIYIMGDGGESVWVTADTEEQALEHLTECGWMGMEVEAIEVEVMSEEDATTLNLVDREESEPDLEEGETYAEDYSAEDYRDGYLCLGTFREVADWSVKPTVIATTMY